MDIESKAAKVELVLNRAKGEIGGHTSDTRELFAAAGVSLRETETADLILLGSRLLPGVGVDKAIADKLSELSLAPFAYLATITGASALSSPLLPERLLTIADPCTAVALTVWRLQVDPSALPPDINMFSRGRVAGTTHAVSR